MKRRHSSALDSVSTSQGICNASVHTQIRIHEINEIHEMNSLDLSLIVLVKDVRI